MAGDISLLPEKPIKPLREIPPVKFDETDERNIQLMQVGVFLMGYNGTRELLEATDDIKEAIDNAKELLKDTAVEFRRLFNVGMEPTRTAIDILKGGLK